MGVIETRTFKSGNSVAVRLPRELGFAAGVEVTIEKVGNALTVRPADKLVEERSRLAALVDTLLSLSPVGEVERREPIAFPDRPGLG